MRGVFTAGVLDAFLDKRLKDFDRYYGVSAGALNLSSYIAGQRGLSQSIYTNLCLEPEFISMSRHLKGGHLFDLDWFFDKLNLQYSLDQLRFKEQLIQRRFTIVTTDISSGTPCYQVINHESSKQILTQSLKASSALPMIYRHPVMINDRPLMDGSLSDPMPVLKAIEDGCTEIILVRSRPVDARKKASPSSRMLAWQYRRQPAIAGLIRQQYNLYNQAADDFESLEFNDHVNLIQVAPKGPLSSTRSTRNRTRLVADYHLGYSQGFALARELGNSEK